MHPFLAFEDILKSYSISRIIIFICGIEGAGKLCSITRQPLSSACLLSMASWPQRTWWRQPSQLLTPLPPSLPTAPPRPDPWVAGRYPAATAHSFCTFTSCSPLEITTTSHDSRRPIPYSFFIFYTLLCSPFIPFLFLPCMKRSEEACVGGGGAQAGGDLPMPQPTTRKET